MLERYSIDDFFILSDIMHITSKVPRVLSNLLKKYAITYNYIGSLKFNGKPDYIYIRS